MSVETKPSATQPSSECTSSDLQPLQQKLLSGNVGLTPSGRAIPFTRAHTLYVSSLRICTVSSRLQSFVASNLHPHWQIRALEAGGGGDCLCHSVGAGLEALFFSGLPGASDHVLRVLPDFHQLSSKVDMMLKLRSMCANAWRHKPAWEVLDHVVAAAQRERIQGAWPDGWSPGSMLINHGFRGVLVFRMQ